MLDTNKINLPKSELEVKISTEYEHIGRMYELMRKGVYAEWFVENDINQAIIKINTLKDVLKNNSTKKYRFLVDDIFGGHRVRYDDIIEAQSYKEACTRSEDIIRSVYGEYLDYDIYECDENGKFLIS